MAHPFLRPWEALAVRLLIRSPRVGAITVKEYGVCGTWTVVDISDPTLQGVDEDSDVLVLGTSKPAEDEPPSMLLERMFHAPDADR